MLPATKWRKSTRSPSSNGQCVEARSQSLHFQLRDSKLARNSPIMNLTKSDFGALLTHLNEDHHD